MATPKQYMIPGAGFVNETADVDKQYIVPGSGYLSETGGGEPEPPAGSGSDSGLFFCNG